MLAACALRFWFVLFCFVIKSVLKNCVILFTLLCQETGDKVRKNLEKPVHSPTYCIYKISNYSKQMLNSPLLHTQTSTSFTINFAINSFPSSVPQERNKACNRDIYSDFFETTCLAGYRHSLQPCLEFWARILGGGVKRGAFQKS